MGGDIWFKSEDGLDLYARSYGPENAQPAVICLHGLTRNHRDFEPMIGALGGEFRFVAIDVRGRGRSQYDAHPERYRPDVYAKDVVTLMDHIGVEKAVLIGTSMGGMISMLLMNMIPDRILGVVLNDVGPRLEAAGLTKIAGYVGASPAMKSWEEAAAAVKETLSDAYPDFDDADWVALARRLRRQTEVGEIVQDYDPAIAGSLKDIKVDAQSEALAWKVFMGMRAAPLLIVRGELSDLFSAATAARMIETHGDASEVVSPREGHAPVLDTPDVIAAISRFLHRVTSAR